MILPTVKMKTDGKLWDWSIKFFLLCIQNKEKQLGLYPPEWRMKMNKGFIMVKETLRAGQKPTKAQITQVRTAAKKPIMYTNDAPRLTVEELAEFKQINAENRKKIPCTLRISKKSLEWWKSLGDGYTAAMARMLEEAQNHPYLLKKII